MTELEWYHTAVDAWDDGCMSDHELVMRVANVPDDVMATRPAAQDLVLAYWARMDCA